MARTLSSSIIHFSPSFETLQFNFKPIPDFKQKNNLILTTITFCNTRPKWAATNSTLAVSVPSLEQSNGQQHWIVVVKPPATQKPDSSTRQDVVDYYVRILDKVLGSEKDAQGCIYNVSCDTQFGFCCDVDKETSLQLACLPEVLSVKPDPNFDYVQKDYSHEKAESGSHNSNFPPLLPAGTSKHWLVRVETPESRVITRAQLVDHYTQILTNVLGNEKDAQMCIYHVSMQSDYGFCCELDDECAKELAGVPGVTSVMPDVNFNSDDKDYGGNSLQHSNIKTKKLFVTGLSFYTSEKTLRAAFEGFGELVEVKIIMDKISKRSKGFAFIEYTTEEAAGAALREMNGKIINGWMIVVDVAKTNPPKYSRGRPRPAS